MPSFLDALYADPAPIYGRYVRRVTFMDPMPEPGPPRTPAQLEALRKARRAQNGMEKAPQRVRR